MKMGEPDGGFRRKGWTGADKGAEKKKMGSRPPCLLQRVHVHIRREKGQNQGLRKGSRAQQEVATLLE